MTTVVEYRARLPVDRRAPSSARRLVRCLDDVIAEGQLDNLELLVTELVTNAVRHAGLDADGWISVELVAGPAAVHVEVCDPGRGFDPGRSTPRAGEERGSGWGLFLVDEVADRWGVGHDDCTRVWFEVTTDARDASLLA